MNAAMAAGLAAAVVLLLGRPRLGALGGSSASGRSRIGGVVLAGTAIAAVLVLVHGTSAVLVVLAALVGAAVLREFRQQRRRAVAVRRGQAVLEACDGLAADLQAGLPPVAALAAAAADWPDLRPVADAAELGADVPDAFRVLAEQPGAESLRLVGAAWVVAHRSGAGLAAAIALAARTIREDRATARVVATELASAQATARLLAVLPVGVLLIGSGAGGDPIGFLVSTTPGLICLAIGLALAWSGLLWLERIADGVRRA